MAPARCQIHALMRMHCSDIAIMLKCDIEHYEMGTNYYQCPFQFNKLLFDL